MKGYIFFFFLIFIDSLHMQPESGTLAPAKDWRMLSSLDTKKNLPLPTRLLLWLEEHFSCSADSPVWPRQRWKMTADRRCCDIPIRARCKSGKQRPELKMYPNEVGTRSFFFFFLGGAKSNYYPTLETSKASGGFLPFFPFSFSNGIHVTVARESACD